MVFRSRMLVMLTEMCLIVTSLKTTEKLLSRFSGKTPTPDAKEAFIILDRYQTAFNLLKQSDGLKGRCLSQSLVMRLLLKRKGIYTDLKIGITQVNGKFDAHAWLEKGGVLINDHPSVIANYLVLPENRKHIRIN